MAGPREIHKQPRGIVPFQGFFQEFFFRGWLQTRMEAGLGRMGGLLLGTGLFVLWHYLAPFASTPGFFSSEIFNEPRDQEQGCNHQRTGRVTDIGTGGKSKAELPAKGVFLYQIGPGGRGAPNGLLFQVQSLL